ncbi:MAG: efflux RND transporter periplasmic adaptor subunit, partial [Rikenellaceae bacterium]
STKNFDSGSLVRKGELIYKIDSRPFEASKSEALSQLMSAKATLQQAQSTYDRSVPLSRINAISTSQLDAALASLTSAAEAVKAAQATLDIANLNMSYCTITAPESGIIAASSAQVGDYVGQATKFPVLTTISFSDSISVTVSLAAREYYSITGQTMPSFQNDSLFRDIEIVFSDGTIYPYKGWYEYTKQMIDSQSGSMMFVLGFVNPNYRLKSGQFVTVRASVGEKQRHVVVPQVCVNEIQGNYYVYTVDKENIAKYTAIEKGAAYKDNFIVNSGLTEGAMVLTEGFFKIKDGTSIQPIETKTE